MIDDNVEELLSPLKRLKTTTTSTETTKTEPVKANGKPQYLIKVDMQREDIAEYDFEYFDVRFTIQQKKFC